MYANSPDSHERLALSKEAPRQLTKAELAERDAHNAMLNEQLYGPRESYEGVAASTYRETNRDPDNSATLAVAGQAEAYVPYSVKQQLTQVEMTANNNAQSLGSSEALRFGDVDTRMAAEVGRAQADDVLSEYGTLQQIEQTKVERATAAEKAISDYIDGRNSVLFEDIDDTIAHTIKASIGQLQQKYGDITKASNEELESIYRLIQNSKGSAQEAADASSAPETKESIRVELQQEVSSVPGVQEQPLVEPDFDHKIYQEMITPRQ